MANVERVIISSSTTVGSYANWLPVRGMECDCVVAVSCGRSFILFLDKSQRTALLKRIMRENLRQGVKLAESTYIRPRSLGQV
jgi:hypothetical protein